MDFQVGSQVHTSHKKSYNSHIIYIQITCVHCCLVLCGQTVKNLRRLAYEFERDSWLLLLMGLGAAYRPYS